MKKVTLEKLLQHQMDKPYAKQYAYIMQLLESGKVIPVKASGKNGKTPALYREYRLTEEKKDYSHLTEELKYQISPLISIDYYLFHPEQYEQDREWVLALSEYLRFRKAELDHQESVNERSFEIWCREKFLTREQGRRILKRCGLDMDVLNVYGTSEPLAYYSHTREVPQNLLILENKDPFYSMRRHLLGGEEEILGVRIGTLIYGGGKGIVRSFQDFEISAEPYMKAEENQMFYFGDLDYEGIIIYESLAREQRGQREILPFAAAYEAMLEKGRRVKNLPQTKEQQNRNIGNDFFSFFSKETVIEMKKILESDRYIPQEILNILDFSEKRGHICSTNF